MSFSTKSRDRDSHYTPVTSGHSIIPESYVPTHLNNERAYSFLLEA
jgi:hypothetical protein